VAGAGPKRVLWSVHALAAHIDQAAEEEGPLGLASAFGFERAGGLDKNAVAAATEIVKQWALGALMRSVLATEPVLVDQQAPVHTDRLQEVHKAMNQCYDIVVKHSTPPTPAVHLIAPSTYHLEQHEAEVLLQSYQHEGKTVPLAGVQFGQRAVRVRVGNIIYNGTNGKDDGPFPKDSCIAASFNNARGQSEVWHGVIRFFFTPFTSQAEESMHWANVGWFLAAPSEIPETLENMASQHRFRVVGRRLARKIDSEQWIPVPSIARKVSVACYSQSICLITDLWDKRQKR